MLSDEIRKFFKGEVLDDPESLKKASHDASIFEIMPRVVACPKDAEDVKALVKFISKKISAGENISLTARSGGTCMSGGTLTRSVVVDLSRHLNKLIDVSPVLPRGNDKITGPRGEIEISGFATVEPGLPYRDFEKETLAKRLLMPSYPASRELCTVGGMVSNNSGGEKTLVYGKTEDYIAELKVVLADGEEHVIRAFGRDELEKKCAEDNFEGKLYARLRDLIQDNYEELRRAKPDVSKNSAGYYLWNVWDRKSGIFDLTKLIAGSQGTLGLVTEIKFRLVRPRPHSLMAVAFLYDLTGLGDIVNEVLKFEPESFESYDDKTLKLAIRFFPQILLRVKRNPIAFCLSFLPDLWMLLRHGWPKLVLMVELTGESEEEIYGRLLKLKAALAAYEVKVHQRSRKTRQAVSSYGLPIHLTHHEREEEKYWITRRESFNLLRKNVKGKHTLPVVDDFIVKPEHLPAFLPELDRILGKYKKYLTSTVAGHVGNGNFHIIPLMDFKDPEARAIVKPLMDEVYGLVLKYKGSITAEHNDGLIRTPYLEKMYGPHIMGLFAEVKNIFDPQNIFNPGKKVPVSPNPLDEALGHMQKS